MTDELDSVTLFLADLDKLSKLTHPERQALWLTMVQEAGTPAGCHAKQTLWKDAVRLVPMIEARVRKGYGGETADPDLLQEGALACGRAVETWDPQAGAFSTWVAHVVRGAMLDYVNEVHKGGVGSKAADVTMVDMHDAVAFSGEATGGEDRPGMSQGFAGISRGELLTYRGVIASDAYTIGDDHVPEGMDEPDREAFKAELHEALNQIRDPLDRKVLVDYYGFDGPAKTLAELAKELGYSVTGVRKRLIAAQEKVKMYL